MIEYPGTLIMSLVFGGIGVFVACAISGILFVKSDKSFDILMLGGIIGSIAIVFTIIPISGDYSKAVTEEIKSAECNELKELNEYYKDSPTFAALTVDEYVFRCLDDKTYEKLSWIRT